MNALSKTLLTTIWITSFACTPVPKLNEDTHFHCAEQTLADYFVKSISQVKDVVPYKMTASIKHDPKVFNWNVYFVPYGKDVGDVVIGKPGDAATSHKDGATWFLETDNYIGNLVSHELGHILGLFIYEPHPSEGVMASPTNVEIFTDEELLSIEKIYQNDW